MIVGAGGTSVSSTVAGSAWSTGGASAVVVLDASYCWRGEQTSARLQAQRRPEAARRTTTESLGTL